MTDVKPETDSKPPNRMRPAWYWPALTFSFGLVLGAGAMVFLQRALVPDEYARSPRTQLLFLGVGVAGGVIWLLTELVAAVVARRNRGQAGKSASE